MVQRGITQFSEENEAISRVRESEGSNVDSEQQEAHLTKAKSKIQVW